VTKRPCLLLALLLLPACSNKTSFPTDAAPREAAVTPDRSPPADAYINPCAPNAPPSLSGRVLAPNGIDPVAGASVGVPIALKALPSTVECESCSVGGRFSAHTTSAHDGTFTLTSIPNGQPFSLAIQKGHFRRVIEVTVPECGHLDLEKEKTTLPGKNAQWGPLDEIPSIAVASGRWDHLEKVLDKLGVQESTIYNGRDYGAGGPDSFQSLLQNGGKLRSHHLLLIDCGTWYDSLAADPGVHANLVDYLRRGGRILATDRSYDFIEQTFPEFVEWERSNGTPASKPETIDAAEGGSDMQEPIPAAINDDDMKGWLSLPEIKALDPGGIVPLQGLQSPWAVMAVVNNGIGGKTWVSAPVVWAGGKGVRPLTASCDYRGSDGTGCGRVIFSSYHTYGDAAELLPQERVLEYLILEIGSCMNLK
jgi:hypothetical protein